MPRMFPGTSWQEQGVAWMGPVWLEDDEEGLRPAPGDGNSSAKQEIVIIIPKQFLVGFSWHKNIEI